MTGSYTTTSGTTGWTGNIGTVGMSGVTGTTTTVSPGIFYNNTDVGRFGYSAHEGISVAYTSGSNSVSNSYSLSGALNKK